MREAALSIYQEYLSDKVGNKATWQQGRQRQLWPQKAALQSSPSLHSDFFKLYLKFPPHPLLNHKSGKLCVTAWSWKKNLLFEVNTKICKTKIIEESKASPGKFLKSPSFLSLLLPILDQLHLNPLHYGHLAFKHRNAHLHTPLQSH